MGDSLRRLVSAAVVPTLLIPIVLSAAPGTGTSVRPRVRDFVDVERLNDIEVDFEDTELDVVSRSAASP